MRNVAQTWRAVLGAVAVALLVTSCRVDTTIDVVADEDGSGSVTVTVELDEEALEAVGDPANTIKSADLTQAGWTVEEPVIGDGATIVASKDFANPVQFTAIMTEISGSGGPLSEFTMERKTPFARTTWEMTGRIDLSNGLEAFGDEALADIVGSPIGWTTEDLEAELGVPAAEAFGFELRVTLDGSIGGNGSKTEDGAMSWTPRLGSDPVEVKGTGNTDNTTALVWVGLGLGALVALAVVLGTRLLRYMRRDSRDYVDDAPTPKHAAGASRAADGAVSEGMDTADARLELVVLGGAGVLYEVGDVAERVMYPLARDLGSDTELERVIELYDQTTLGRRTTMEFWQALGLGGDPQAHDRDYLMRARLSANVIPFIEKMRERGLQLAVLDNDSAHWSSGLRRRFRLDDSIDHFVISAEVGARLPDESMFEALRRASGVGPANMLYLGTVESHLSAGADFGMATVWFAPPTGVATGEARVVRGFRDFFKPVTT
ncbi:MAG: HAD hydrolase-like protein [Acidobacteria bacterium]|nr:HAD hydrolase-like protein [Acidobacteriota bacterium]